MSASVQMIAADKDGMGAAVRAARNALSACAIDYSNGAYFWDGKDIKTNYATHKKVKDGIHFTNPSHNVYGIKERAVSGKFFWQDARGNDTSRLRGTWTYRYESTAGIGGTIFWRLSPEFIKATGNKEYK